MQGAVWSEVHAKRDAETSLCPKLACRQSGSSTGDKVLSVIRALKLQPAIFCYLMANHTRCAQDAVVT
jgi:hypothetical protein